MFDKLKLEYKKFSGNKKNIFYDISTLEELKCLVKSDDYSSLTDVELKNKFRMFYSQNDFNPNNNTTIINVYKIVYEVIKRTLNITPYDSQILGALALNQKYIVEMQTGEGKTLSAVFPACLNSISKKGVHILTFNDYLSKRDCKWMSPVYDFLGLKCSYITEKTDKKFRKEAYNNDITYLTAKEAGFDYLKDFLALSRNELIQRDFNYAIVDEVDSILIDEAKIPLVIGGILENETVERKEITSSIKQLEYKKDYYIDNNGNNIYLTDDGFKKTEYLLDCENLYAESNIELLTRVNSALFAVFLLKKDIHYIVKNNKIELIDEFTGRIAEKRNWPDYIQEAIEEKEGIESIEKGKIMSSITLQHFINLYPKLAGMTGTAATSSEEFKEIYNLDTIIIPTQKPDIRKDYTPYVFKNKSLKYKYLIEEIKKINKNGQPILVGTQSIEESEKIGALVRKENLECNILNAKNDELEAEIISKAGDLNTITISTNMAGRGVDIKLGGNNEENYNQVIKTGGLYIIGTSLNQNERIDNQLRGRSGRQGDPGETRFFVSLDDELFVNFDTKKLLYIDDKISDEKLKTNKKIIKNIKVIQRFANGYNSDLKNQMLEYSNFIEDQRKFIHKKRTSIINGSETSNIVEKISKDTKKNIYSKFDKEYIETLINKIYLKEINSEWTSYLEQMAYEKESIHLVSLGNKNPLTEFHKIAIDNFNSMLENIDKNSVETIENLNFDSTTPEDILSDIKGPSSTWTYFIDDNFGKFKKNSLLFKSLLYMLVSGG
jgi:preprotein translocase subunit SecA